MTKQTLTDETRIEVRSLVPSVHYTCPITYEIFDWLSTGDTQEMTYKQLRIMKTKHPRFFSERWIMPLDDEVTEKLGLKHLYERSLNRGDMKKLYEDDIDAAKEMLDTINDAALKALAQKVPEAIKNGRIGNAKIIRLLEAKLGIDLMSLI